MSGVRLAGPTSALTEMSVGNWVDDAGSFMNATTEADAAQRQERMIRQQVIERGIQDQRVLGAMRAVPREPFFPAELKSEAFADRAVGIGHGQTISQPYIVALMTLRLNILPGQKVLEVGTGSGYQTAIVSKLTDQVYTIERVKPLLDSAWERLMSLDIRGVRFRHGDGTVGWPETAPFDRILITAGAPALPEAMLLNQLLDGGIAVLPVGPFDRQMLVEVRREGAMLKTREICPCRFVKLIGSAGWAE
jgi:protein-L-isoaspartate(D-aspartate) O-methyltransferase